MLFIDADLPNALSETKQVAPSAPVPVENAPVKIRGPHIAKVELLPVAGGRMGT